MRITCLLQIDSLLLCLSCSGLLIDNLEMIRVFSSITNCKNPRILGLRLERVI
jgi:hypothetical protein